MQKEFINKIEPQQAMWIPERGIVTLLPTHASTALGSAVANEEPVPSFESERLQVIASDWANKKRYPTMEAGLRFMEEIDHERREKLLKRAQSFTVHVVNQWNRINPDKDITVALYGSVARGLVKNGRNPDPSNIDLVILGDFTDGERLKLLKAIRKKRQKFKRKNLRELENKIERKDTNPGNVNVSVQNIEQVSHSNFGEIINYVGSCTQPLYNPELWMELEQKALEARRQNRASKRRRYGRRVIFGQTDSAISHSLVNPMELVQPELGLQSSFFDQAAQPGFSHTSAARHS